MSSERLNQIVELCQAPISDASPVGDPVRYEEDFEELQGEMDKIGSLTGENPNWRRVVELSTEITRSKSKDLLVLTYLVLGLFETERYAGLAAGFAGYTAFIKAHWERCYPKIKPPHGRYNAIQYLADKIEPLVELKGGPLVAPQPSEKEAVHLCHEHVSAYDEAVTAAFTGQPETPNLLPLVRDFKALKEKVGPLVEDPPPAPPPTAAPVEGAPPTAASAAPAAAPASDDGGGVAIPDQFSSPTQAQQSVVKIAKYFLGQNDKDARGYRLMRAAHFGALLQPPKDKLIPPPPAARRTFFENAAAQGDWANLLKQAEGQFATTPLWLDMQRYVALAAKNCGPAYAAVHDAVAFEAVALYQRLPAVFDLSFKDGKGFADAGTKGWIEELAGSLGGGGGGGGGGGAGDAVGAAISEARKLLSEAKTADAVARLSDAIENSGSRRQRFRAQLALAGMCLDMNRLSLANSILEGLERTIDEYNLAEWEPELAADAMADLYNCLTKLKPKPTPEDAIRASEVFARLCRLDPAAAFKLDAAKKKT